MPAVRFAALISLALLLCSACAPAKVVGPPILVPPQVRPPPVVVVLEPFFENAPFDLKPRPKTYTSWSGVGPPQEVTVYQDVQEKPLFARIAALEVEHRIVLDEMRRLRPDWRIISTGELPSVEGPVRLVRVIIGDDEIVGSNRALLSVATAFGVVIWPLLLVNLQPVHEATQVQGTLTLYEANASELRARLLRYQTQPDFAVDTRGLATPRVQPFAVDVEYEEGLFASNEKRGPVLLRGFSERLAPAVVALVEGLQ